MPSKSCGSKTWKPSDQRNQEFNVECIMKNEFTPFAPLKIIIVNMELENHLLE